MQTSNIMSNIAHEVLCTKKTKADSSTKTYAVALHTLVEEPSTVDIFM